MLCTDSINFYIIVQYHFATSKNICWIQVWEIKFSIDYEWMKCWIYKIGDSYIPNVLGFCWRFDVFLFCDHESLIRCYSRLGMRIDYAELGFARPKPGLPKFLRPKPDLRPVIDLLFSPEPESLIRSASMFKSIYHMKIFK